MARSLQTGTGTSDGSTQQSIYRGGGITHATISLTAADSNASPVIRKIELCRTQEAGRYYLTNDTLGFLPGLFFVSIGLCCIGAALLLWRRWDLSRLSLYFGTALLCISVELFDTGGHYLVFGVDPHLWNVLFYLNTYLIPVACMLYSWELVRDQFSVAENKIMRFAVLLGAAFGSIAAFLVAATSLRFCDFSVPYLISLMVCGLFALYGIFLIIKKKLFSKSGISLVLILVAWLFVAIALSLSTTPFVNSSGAPRIDLETVEAVFVFFVTGYVFVHVIARHEHERKEKEKRVLQLENELKESRIRFFTSQMQPHFLYNTLSSIQDIVLDNPDYASALIGNFTTYLRGCIRSMSEERPILFSQELANIRAYVEIEKMRLTDRLEVVYDIGPAAFYVVPLSIQPLVENAIRHGIFGRGPEGGTVWIRSFKEEEFFVVQIRDNGVGFAAEETLAQIRNQKTDSYGLRNLMFRLEKGVHASIQFQSKIGEGTTVTVRIPVKRKEGGVTA